MTLHRHHSLRVLVTGAAGFLGSHAVDLLLDEGHVVLGIDDLSSGRRARLDGARSRGFRLVDDDLLHGGVLEKAVDAFRPEVILHTAGMAGVTKAEQWPGRNQRLHVEATRLVAETARTRGIGRVVLASSAAVYRERGTRSRPARELEALAPGTALGRAKMESEQILEQLEQSEGITCVSARLFNVYGGRQDAASAGASVVTIFAERFRNRQPVTILGDGMQTRDFLWWEDAVRGLVLAATRPGLAGGAYNLCTGEAQTVREIAGRFAEAVPRAPDPIFAPARAVDFNQGAGDPSQAREALGFSALVSLDEGIRKMLEPAGKALRRAA